MGFLDRLARAIGPRREERAKDPSWSGISPGFGYTSALSARAAENLTTVVACAGVIGTSLGSIPALVYRTDADGNRTELSDHPLTRLTRSGVSERMSWPDFIEHLATSALLHGNGLAEVVTGPRGELRALEFIPWSMVTVVYLSTGRLAFDISDPRLNGRSRRLLQSEVIHLRDRTDDGLVGRSRLSRASEAVAGIAASNTFAHSFLANGAAPSGVIELPGLISQESRDRLRASLDSRHAGTANAGKTLLLDGGMTWKNTQISPEDAELLETRKFGIEEICRLFQVPPPLVQDYSHNTFTNSETAGRWFAMFTLAPWARKIEAEFARSVFPPDSAMHMELDLSGFLRGDPKTRWDAHKIAIETGVLDKDEVRQIEGWNARPPAAQPGGQGAPATDPMPDPANPGGGGEPGPPAPAITG